MPWHLSKSDPRKVYDERHQSVCVCQTPEQAGKIVGAVNALPRDTAETFVRLREPQPLQPPGPLDTFEPDASCCGREIAKAARGNVLQALQSWECPKCGCEWYPGLVAGAVRHWQPKPAVMVFR